MALSVREIADAIDHDNGFVRIYTKPGGAYIHKEQIDANQLIDALLLLLNKPKDESVLSSDQQRILELSETLRWAVSSEHANYHKHELGGWRECGMPTCCYVAYIFAKGKHGG